jgi:hypothetical protein
MAHPLTARAQAAADPDTGGFRPGLTEASHYRRGHGFIAGTSIGPRRVKLYRPQRLGALAII